MRTCASRCLPAALAACGLLLAGPLTAGPLASTEYTAGQHLPGPAPVAAHHQDGLYRTGDDITRHISAETAQRLRAALHVEGVSMASMARFKPWLVANLLLSMTLERQGYMEMRPN
jgi:hypothetical protein